VVFSANPLTTLVFVVFGYLIGIIEHTDVTLTDIILIKNLIKLKVITGISVIVSS
jgi:hypothetical protein